MPQKHNGLIFDIWAQIQRTLVIQKDKMNISKEANEIFTLQELLFS